MLRSPSWFDKPSPVRLQNHLRSWREPVILSDVVLFVIRYDGSDPTPVALIKTHTHTALANKDQTSIVQGQRKLSLCWVLVRIVVLGFIILVLF